MKLAVVSLVVVTAGCARDARTQAPRSGSEGTVPDVERVTDEPAAQQRQILVDPGADDGRAVREAIAVLQPMRGSKVTGQIRFRQLDDGLEVFATVDNLPGGVHAYHVHVFGDCSAPDGTSAGPHFHFTGSSFDKEVPMITGNLGELRDPGSHTATHRAMIPMASLHGGYSILGRSVVVHAKGNDPTVTPDGGAGDRIACGVIGVANTEPPRAARR
jgi:superoxide dismutase, Cu-Zn family